MVRRPSFTQRSVETATCPAGRKDTLIFDGEVRGLGLRVTSSGSKIFLLQYSVAGTKRRTRLGEFGALTVKEARQRARTLLGEVAAGRDPEHDRRQAVIARRHVETAAKVREVEDEYTFEKLMTGWQAARDGDRRARYLKEASSSLRRHFTSWLPRPASSITRAEAIDALDRIKLSAGPIAANRCLSYSRAAFGWATKRGRLATNPLAGLEPSTREKPRDRVLSRDEVGAIWRACSALLYPYGEYLRVLLLTLQRRDEVAGLSWDELDDASNPTTWILPAARAKNAKKHLVHLSDPVRAIIGGMPKIEGVPYIFASERGRPIAAFSAAKRRLLSAMTAELPEGDKVASDWRQHDFRRSGVTALAEMGFPPHVADKLLNHVTGTIQGVAAVYQRAEFLAERRAALDAWASYVLAAAEQRQPSDNVVPLARPA